MIDFRGQMGITMSMAPWRTRAALDLGSLPRRWRGLCPSGSLIAIVDSLGLPLRRLARLMGLGYHDLRATVHEGPRRRHGLVIDPLGDRVEELLGLTRFLATSQLATRQKGSVSLQDVAEVARLGWPVGGLAEAVVSVRRALRGVWGKGSQDRATGGSEGCVKSDTTPPHPFEGGSGRGA